ncbi:uncharacterized protein N0V89_002666 [Didymosphaeria variabile]|uniref:Uncharacterized protein n=1 Tax=Didymosphaeria variabile TaxID=1932322 RepID=A0A9W9CEK7_9PLEO|nr:uncharacterized protein N0V89_002666 [Didymosphaeria variabile]KAJ4358087.1 hypothetical protein N0V89_002666 [Didymosphaeria variabile]
MVHIDEPDVFMDVRSRADSLAPVPDHLERIETPDSILRPVKRLVHESPPRVIQTVQRSPSQPVPRPSFFERHSHRGLSNAIEGLEDLVEDAVVTAELMERPEHVKQIYTIIEDASIAVQDASLEPARLLMRTSSPLQVSAKEADRADEEAVPRIIGDLAGIAVAGEAQIQHRTHRANIVAIVYLLNLAPRSTKKN